MICSAALTFMIFKSNNSWSDCLSDSISAPSKRSMATWSILHSTKLRFQGACSAASSKLTQKFCHWAGLLLCSARTPCSIGVNSLRSWVCFCCKKRCSSVDWNSFLSSSNWQRTTRIWNGLTTCKRDWRSSNLLSGRPRSCKTSRLWFCGTRLGSS